jgi:predicted O-methyltransferase YrrM
MEQKKQVTGFTSYKGIMLQQHEDYQKVFSKLLEDTKPARILEIGTGAGGLTLFLRDKLNEIGLRETYIKSYDVNTTSFDNNVHDLTNLELSKENLFGGGNEFILERGDLIEPYIKSEGLTIVLCDGGNKIKEFNQISPLLKSGDIIMAHDYCENSNLFESDYKDKIWNWCEIQERDIETICQQENLEDFMKEYFNKIVWVCKIKN